MAGGEIPIAGLFHGIPFFYCSPEMNTHKTGATIEGPPVDARHAIGNRDARKAVATREGLIADARQLAVFTEADVRKAGATIESSIADARQLAVFTEADARKALATIEGITADARHARRNRDAR